MSVLNATQNQFSNYRLDDDHTENYIGTGRESTSKLASSSPTHLPTLLRHNTYGIAGLPASHLITGLLPSKRSEDIQLSRPMTPELQSACIH